MLPEQIKFIKIVLSLKIWAGPKQEVDHRAIHSHARMKQIFVTNDHRPYYRLRVWTYTLDCSALYEYAIQIYDLSGAISHTLLHLLYWVL